MANDAVDELADDLFPNHADQPAASLEDRATAVYFKKLAQYTEHRTTLTEQLGAAFHLFARANYVSQGRRFDQTCWDHTVQATRKLGWSAKKQYKLDVKKAHEEANAAREKATSKRGVLVKNIDTLTNRKQKGKAGDDDDAAIEPNFVHVEVPKVYNPLDMFSTFPPLELRKSQTGFENAVDAIEAAAKVMWELQEIEKVVFVDKDLEGMKKILEKDEEQEKEEERFWKLQEQERLEKEMHDRKMQYSIRKKKGLATK